MGEVQEEELEGEAVAGPSREATLHSSGSTPLVVFLLFFQNFMPKYILKKTSLFFQFILPIFYLSLFLTDESTEEEAPQPLTKEEEDINTLQSWIQVGVSLHDLRRRHRGC